MIGRVAFAIALSLALGACTTDPGTARQQSLAKIVSRASTGQGTAPILDAVQFHEARQRYLVIYPEFHFHAVDGNVVALHRMLVSTDKRGLPLDIRPDAYVDIPAEQQMRGASFVGGWNCNAEAYTATMQAFLVDANGNHSNAREYVIQCKGE